jgi:CRP-like cAMP-binding protein
MHTMLRMHPLLEAHALTAMNMHEHEHERMRARAACACVRAASAQVGTDMYILKSGEVKVELTNGLEVARLRRGNFFGEMAVVRRHSSHPHPDRHPNPVGLAQTTPRHVLQRNGRRASPRPSQCPAPRHGSHTVHALHCCMHPARTVLTDSVCALSPH